mmetsp:Transcript_121094/g.328622  ORF Transcript_121094/g.328622 Transcript_121094/m.328622 type:complete len:254 (-) Transcript_121094:40-801(-)
MGSRAGGNSALELKHHVLNGRLAQAKKLLASTRISLEDCQDEDGNTALHWCAQGLQADAEGRDAPDEETLVFLLQNGAPKNRQNAIGETPLMATVRLATLDPARAEALISAMLTKGHADPCRADISGETPLMEAAAAGLEGIGRLLLEHRASPLAESSSGLTAAQLAEESGSEAFALLLRSPLAERAAREARAEEAQGRSEEDLQRQREQRREKQAKKFEQTLFGQRLRPGLAADKDRPGKPYPEYGTLHDID